MTHMNRPHMKKSLFPPGMYCVMSLESFTPALCALNLIEGFFWKLAQNRLYQQTA